MEDGAGVMICVRCSAFMHEDRAFAADAKREGVDVRRVVCINGHGRVITPPRPSPLRKVTITAHILRDWYVLQRLTAEQIGERLGVTATPVLDALRRAGIPRRLTRATMYCIETDCKRPTVKRRHAGNGAAYGRRCLAHFFAHRARSARRWRARRKVAA